MKNLTPRLLALSLGLLGLSLGSLGCDSLPARAQVLETGQAPPAVASNLPAPMDISIPHPPQAVLSDGQMRLVYEIFITNMSPQERVFTGLRALGTGDAEVGSTSGASLANITFPNPQVRDGGVVVPSTGRLVVYMFLSFPNAGAVPSQLNHVLTFNGAPDLRLEDPLPVNKSAPRVLGQPVRGGPWLCDGGLANSSYHRRTILTAGGKSRIGQRYAVDFEVMNSNGKTFVGDPSLNSSYPAYGKEILCVADGTVVFLKDGLPDNTPPQVPTPNDIDSIAGNSIVVDVGNGQFVAYGHLQPHTATVHVGDTVTRGQVLGVIGNSGNSFEPHLHLQLCNRGSFAASQGDAYVFDGYDVIEGNVSTPVTLSLPALNQVIRFPGVLGSQLPAPTHPIAPRHRCGCGDYFEHLVESRIF